MTELATVPDMVAASLALTDPSAVLIHSGDTETTFAEIDTWAAAVAARLRTAGVGPDDLVPVLIDRGPALVAAWLGVLRAGAAFVPLDPRLPTTRVEEILDAVAAPAVLADESPFRSDSSEKGIHNPPERPFLSVDPSRMGIGAAPGIGWGLPAQPSVLPLIKKAASPVGAGDRAAVFFPVEAGAPGVVLSHGNLLHAALTTAWLHDLGPGEQLSGVASPASVRAVAEAFACLCSGARLVMADEEKPSPWLAAECSGIFAVDSLSRPVPNSRVYVLGSALEELPAGVEGEVYVAGPGVASGYFGRPELTAQRFPPDPYEPGANLYRTGERAIRGAGGEVTLVDRTVRPAPLPARRASDVATPGRTRAAELFAEALAQSGLGPDTDFFARGGHSLLAVRMLARASARWGVTVRMRDFLLAPTVAGLGDLLDAAAPVAQATPTPQDTWHLATPAQQRLWFLDRIAHLRSAYLVPFALEYTGDVDPGRLRDAVTLVLGRHPALRSRFRLDRQRRALVYRTDGSPPEVHIGGPDVLWTPFDLAEDAPARATIVVTGDRTVLALTASHVVLDGWSLRLLIEEIGAAYRGEDLPPAIHPATIPATGGADLDKTLAGLRGVPTDIDLPYDRPRPDTQPTKGATATIGLGHDLTRRLRTVAAEHRCTTFMVLVALLSVSLARRSGQRDFVFAYPWANRDTPGSADAVGMFAATLLIRATLTGRPSWRGLLAQIQEHATDSLAAGDVPFDALAAALHPDRELNRPPVTPVLVSVLDTPLTAPDLGPGTAGRVLPWDSRHVKYELAVTAVEHQDELELSIDYAVDLFDRDTVAALLSDLRARARELVTNQEAAVIDPVERVREAWQEVLAIEQAPTDVSFFDAGGNSLLLIMLLDELTALTDQPLTAADLFRHNTVSSQARLLTGDVEQPETRTPAQRAGLLGRARRSANS